MEFGEITLFIIFVPLISSSELNQLAEISGTKIINKVISPNSIDIKKLGFVKKLIIKKNNIEIK